MVVLMEEFGGLSLKRKGADEPELLAVGDRSGFPLSCRATKMRRLACPDSQQAQNCREEGPAVSDGGRVQGQVDLPMGDAAPSPAASASVEEEKAMVLYSGGAPPDSAQSASRLRPCGVHVRDGADWVRAMLREADSRTVRELLVGAQEQGTSMELAIVPWVPPSPAEEAEPSAAQEEVDAGDSNGAAAMDVEEEEDQVHHWTRHQPTQPTFGSAGAGCGEGYVYRWPQQCMAPPQLPVVGQASPVMWSW